MRVEDQIILDAPGICIALYQKRKKRKEKEKDIIQYKPYGFKELTNNYEKKKTKTKE